jgi:hypothetical protein
MFLLLFQFKNGKHEWVEAHELYGLRLGNAWDRSLGTRVWYQL